jgi:hypothetical protein
MDASVQWADSILALERLFFLKLAVWGALSVVAGSALLALARRETTSAALSSLSLVLVIGGTLEVAIALVCRQGVRLRDLGAATSLDRMLWFVAGIAVGWTSAALFAAMRARARLPASAASVGSAIGLALHGVAIAFLTTQLARALIR